MMNFCICRINRSNLIIKEVERIEYNKAKARANPIPISPYCFALSKRFAPTSNPTAIVIAIAKLSGVIYNKEAKFIGAGEPQ